MSTSWPPASAARGGCGSPARYRWGRSSAVHVVNNALAFTLTADSAVAAPLGMTLGLAMLLVCVAAPARQASSAN